MKKKLRSRAIFIAVVICVMSAALTGVGVRIILERSSKVKIGELLQLEGVPSRSDILHAIPNQFDKGITRKEVWSRIFEIYPDIDVNDPHHTLEDHSLKNCNQGWCVDHVRFYGDDWVENLYISFSYDQKGKLHKVYYEES